ncbi:MAG: xanthine phosphoribosyltransferase [Clostridiales bacterium]|nr:xanthine phosphoribosyltransferase [Clostridiales bacterium]MBS5878442.1 xanthine phosphoribosyltransferase [Clostridiales bacterium]MDU1042756.1 xanthine phosphoribosyltransferase [Clostridiales bacterium]MDU3489726.1 xanthine phosphoribosyltransferase [Clostridiales bacterium]
MKLLEDRIRKEGRILPGNILKVDRFLNHQVDPELMIEMGKDFAEHFRDKEITRVLTLEVSGIAMALTTALELGVPMVFAKKISSVTLADDTYTSKVYSYTKKKEYDIRVDKHYICPEDRVLIIDDFLAMGQALNGLVELVDQAGAAVAGIGIAIEKAFQNGGKKYRDMGYDVYSLAMIEDFKDDGVVFVGEE